MAHTSKKKRKKKRPRTVPRNIHEKTDREIMDRIFGKRVLRAADREMAEWRDKHPPPEIPERHVTE